MFEAAAVATATVSGVFGFPFRYYQCWYSWSRCRTVVGVLLYLVIVGGGGGFVAWLVGNSETPRPTPHEWVNGVIYGVAGILILRASVKSRRRTRGDRTVADTVSVLSYGIAWTSDFFGEIVVREARAWLRGLSDQDLLLHTVDIAVDIENRRLSPQTKKKLLRQVAEAAEAVNHDDMTTHTEGRARLVAFCGTYYAANHLVKP